MDFVVIAKESVSKDLVSYTVHEDVRMWNA